MVLGSLLTKERYQFSDEETVAHITMNPYLQYFIGLEAFTHKSPFDQSMMTRFRKRISTKTLQEVNDIIIGNKKPRTYREKAKRQYNSFSKSRKKSRKNIRQTIRRQLGYLKRDLAIIDQIEKKHPDYAKYLPQWLKDRLPVIRLLYAQQQEMYSTNTHRVENRIVSLSQPWVRPIVRGKQNAEVEFGANMLFVQ